MIRLPDEKRLLELEPHAGLAQDFLLWPDRLNLHPSQSLSVYFRNAYDVHERFVQSLCASDPRLYRDDAIDRVHGFTQALTAFAKEGYAVLPALYWMVLRPADLRIRFIDRRPFVDRGTGRYSDWLLLVSDIDPDALVTLDLARRLGAQGMGGGDGIDRAAAFADWPLVYHDGDNDLRGLLARGVSDLHLHLKSANPVAVLWRRICASPRLLDMARAFADQPFGTGSAPHPDRATDRAVIEAGVALVRKDTQALPLPLLETDAGQGCFEVLSGADTDRFEARRISPLMAPYRRGMTGIWQSLFGPQNEGRDSLENDFDRYLVAKQRFRRLQLQSLRHTNPGLSAFDELRKRSSHLGRFHAEEAQGTRFHPLRFVLNNGLLVRALESDPHLQRVDMRIAPPGVSASTIGRAYAQTGKGLARLKSLGHLDGISAVHFKRAYRKGGRDAKGIASGPLIRKLQEYDLETAGLQLMRARLSGAGATRTEQGNRALGMLGRVDLASPERGASPDRIAPYIRLLRGYLPTYEALERLPSGAPFVARWRTLAREGIARPDPLAPRLGATVHAGEDFDTLVQGLYHIDRAIETWRLEPGEGLGHCLALGRSMLNEERYTEILRTKGTSQGHDLDELLWLDSMIADEPTIPESLRQKLRRAITSLSRRIYGGVGEKLGIDPLNIEILRRKVLRADRFLAIEIPTGSLTGNIGLAAEAVREQIGDQADRLRAADLFIAPVAAYRAKRTRAEAVHEDLRDVLGLIQEKIVDTIMARGLVIETNPSSNLRMEALHHPQDLPLVELMRRENGPRITICTDNPGTFDVSISCEYALIFEALVNGDGGLTRDAALARLEAMQRVGMETALGGEPPALTRPAAKDRHRDRP